MMALTILLIAWSIHIRNNRRIVGATIAAGRTIGSYHTMKVYVPLLGLAALVIYGRTVIRLKREALFYAVVLLIIIGGPVLYTSILDPGGRARADQVSVLKVPDAGPALVVQQY